jgi:hypothetical protein
LIVIIVLICCFRKKCKQWALQKLVENKNQLIEIGFISVYFRQLNREHRHEQKLEERRAAAEVR